MRQSQIRYGSQHQVFFLATLALFPDKLTVRPLDPWFFSPYFNFAYGNQLNTGRNKQDRELELAELMLADYKNNGYIEYAKVNGLFEITKIDTAKAMNDLVLYLNQWQQNELLSVSATKPPDPVHQQSLLLTAIKRAHTHQSTPRVSMADIYGEPSSYKYKPPFWELVLSYQLLDKKIDITDMGYDTRDDGLYEKNAQPFIEVEIIDEELATLVETKSAPPTAAADVVSTRQPAQREARVFIHEQFVCVAVTGDKTYKIAKLGENKSYHKFMKYLLKEENHDINILLSDVKDIKGLQAAHDLTELVRYSGFDMALKRAFFKTCKPDRLNFNPISELNDQQFQAVKEKAAKLELKNRE